ncbi:hypothetical protein FACS1894217_02370 [Clostridia bacterium]|nr:hypothetical protein FACS1894217_02370 [Clostridia bacterium]
MLKKIMLLLLTAVLLSGLLSAGIYIFVTQPRYVQMRADELLPIARTIADMTGGIIIFDRGNKNFLGAELRIYDADGRSDMGGPPNKDRQRPDEISVEDLQSILNGAELSATRSLPDGRSYLIVGVPTATGGAVVFTKPLSELNDAMAGLNFTLIAGTLISFLIMSIPAYWIARESGKLEQTRRDYVSNVSHELRTPISAIRAMGETLRDGMTKTQEKRDLFYNNIVRESMRLSRLVDDLLELSRLQSGAQAMKKHRFDLRQTISNVCDVYLETEDRLEFQVDVDMENPLTVVSNPDRIEQVLVILLDNAIKHTPDGGRVRLTAAKRSGGLTVAVSNTGEGIAKVDLPYVFERFYKADKSHSGGGSGLGLSIAKEIMNGLGGKLSVSSESGLTTFELTIDN